MSNENEEYNFVVANEEANEPVPENTNGISHLNENTGELMTFATVKERNNYLKKKIFEKIPLIGPMNLVVFITAGQTDPLIREYQIDELLNLNNETMRFKSVKIFFGVLKTVNPSPAQVQTIKTLAEENLKDWERGSELRSILESRPELDVKVHYSPDGGEDDRPFKTLLPDLLKEDTIMYILGHGSGPIAPDTRSNINFYNTSITPRNSPRGYQGLMGDELLSIMSENKRAGFDPSVIIITNACYSRNFLKHEDLADFPKYVYISVDNSREGECTTNTKFRPMMKFFQQVGTAKLRTLNEAVDSFVSSDAVNESNLDNGLYIVGDYRRSNVRFRMPPKGYRRRNHEIVEFNQYERYGADGGSTRKRMKKMTKRSSTKKRHGLNKP